MNLSLISLELWVVVLGLALLLADLWATPGLRRTLGYLAVVGLVGILALSFRDPVSAGGSPLDDMFVLDGFSLFFKRFFLVAAALVILMAAESAEQLESGVTEYYSLVLFALAGMMLAASANHFAVLFVSLELITITFYVLTGFQRRRLPSLEAAVKYLILGALSSAFLIYGIALIYGSSGTLSFEALALRSVSLMHDRLLQIGLLLVLAGLGFKIAMVPFQFWVPDVYQGSPTPTTAFLAVGSKAAGFVLLLRLLHFAVPALACQWQELLILLAGLTILYGNLCAIPQQNLKRLLGYSSIANAGYLLMGVAVLTPAGSAATLYYLGGYLFTLLAAFTVISIILQKAEVEDMTALAGLSKRSPFLAAVLTLAMISLAGVPPLAGFFGKFLLIKSVLEQGAGHHAFYWLTGVAIVGVVISLYYYFGVIRAIYWSTKNDADLSPIPVSLLSRFALMICAAGMLYLGLLPGALLDWAEEVTKALL